MFTENTLWQGFVTGHSVLCDSQKVQTSLHRQRPTQYAHTGDSTMGYTRRPAAYIKYRTGVPQRGLVLK